MKELINIGKIRGNNDLLQIPAPQCLLNRVGQQRFSSQDFKILLRDALATIPRRNYRNVIYHMFQTLLRSV
jgi:hypothetical protein